MTEAALVEVEGSIDRIRFAKDGFVIGVLFTGKDRVAFKGNLGDINEGDDLRLSGRWIDDPKWGKQLEALGATPAIPKHVNGVKKWITKYIEGIGGRGAEMLVERFGKDAPKVLEPRTDSSDDPLLDLPGMNPEKAAQARACYAALGNFPEVQLWLAEHGIVGAFAGRVVKQYGAETRTVLEANPYAPIEDVEGFAFRRADELAHQLGVRDHDPRRAKAAILSAFDEEAQNGHVWLSPEEVEAALAKDFCVPIEATREGVEKLLADSSVVTEGTQVRRLYRTPMRNAEVSLCFDMLRLLDAAKNLEWLVPVPDARLNPEQQAAVNLAAESPVVIITGPPGTGKSHTLKAILDLVDPDRRSTLLMAPTGRAAKRMTQATGMEAKTIHRGLEFGPGPEGGDMRFQRDRKNPLLQRNVVVDETSMLDLELAASLLAAIPSGARLILLGDIDQLPSVGPGTVLKDLIECELVPVARLIRNMRSKEGGDISNVAIKIVAGERIDEEDLRGDITLLQVENAETVAKEIVRLVAGGIPDYAPGLIQVLCPQRKGPCGTADLNVALQAAVNPPRLGLGEVKVGDTIFRVGDKVLVTKNDYELGVFNGDTGIVEKADAGESSKKRRLAVQMDDGQRVVFEKDALNILQLSYAMTVHKSQGSEYRVVVMPVHSTNSFMLYKNLLYTGVTRARERVYLVGERKALSRAVKRDDPMKRNTSLWARIRHLASKAASS